MPRWNKKVRRDTGRKTRPWLRSVLPPTHYSSFLYPRHLALMEALTPYVLADVQQRMEEAKALGKLDADPGYIAEVVCRPDIFLYALEETAKRKHLNIEQIVNQYIDRKQREQLEAILFGE